MWVTNSFSLAAFNIHSLSLNTCILIIMCLGVVLFGFIFFGTLCASWICMSSSFIRLGKFSDIIFSKVCNFLLSLFSFQHPHSVNVGFLVVVPEALYTLLVFFGFFFFLLFCFSVFCFIIFQVADLILSFIYSIVDSL